MEKNKQSKSSTFLATIITGIEKKKKKHVPGMLMLQVRSLLGKRSVFWRRKVYIEKKLKVKLVETCASLPYPIGYEEEKILCMRSLRHPMY